ncbi:hypothetical protein C8A00DRAFT_45114 [Chaetomidium leptoderma]|uniref:Uncharacterized protein n=1 Tax=Chaetomidium leptoderma TaxID=669021 RepID=A0AAN6VK74_9PEZI|nr:hypothetical protein C8A00DRAFT_45114 [Chaetomidium leptoderma]
MAPIADVSDIEFTNELKRTPSAEQAVHRGGETWHTGGTDPNAPEHLTVEFLDSNGDHVTTKHIDRNGQAC